MKKQLNKKLSAVKTGKGNGCEHYKKCGGCQLLNMDYNEQLSFKQVKTIRLLGRFCHVDEIIGMEHPFHYRNKVQAAFGTTRGGKIISGVYQSSTHNIVNVTECKLEDKKADEIIVTIRKLLESFRLSPFNEDTGKGFLRHVLVKRGFSTGEIMVVLVTAAPEFPHKNNFVAELRKRHPEITTIVQNINSQNTTFVLGDKNKPLYGEGFIEDVLCGLRFRISPNSFYQVNAAQTQVLYKKAIQAAGLTGKEMVIDAYCGIGTIGMAMASKAGKVLGIELNKDAVKDAKANAKRNHIENIRFVGGDATEYMTRMSQEREKVDVVVMDPPRSGSTEAFVKAVGSLKPDRVVYVSCNPETLGRDLEWFKKQGYVAKEAWPVDMFGWTEHVECVVALERQ